MTLNYEDFKQSVLESVLLVESFKDEDLKAAYELIDEFDKIKKGTVLVGRSTMKDLESISNFKTLKHLIDIGIAEFGTFSMKSKTGQPDGINVKLTSKGAKEIINKFGQNTK